MGHTLYYCKRQLMEAEKTTFRHAKFPFPFPILFNFPRTSISLNQCMQIYGIWAWAPLAVSMYLYLPINQKCSLASVLSSRVIHLFAVAITLQEAQVKLARTCEKVFQASLIDVKRHAEPLSLMRQSPCFLQNNKSVSRCCR